MALGQAVGQLLLDARADDGFDIPDPFAPTPGPGVWEPTPPAFAPMVEAQFQNVRPFTLRDRSQFLPAPPPALASARYARDFNEVKRLGQDTSPLRTADQTQLAHFWVEGSPVGWSRVGTHRLVAPGLRPPPNRAAARSPEHGHGRWLRRRLVPEAALRILAAGDGDPERRRPTATPAPARTRTGCHFVRRRPFRTTPRPTASSAARQPRSCGGSPDRTTSASA